MTKYNQLVRDGSPALIEANWMSVKTHVANEKEMFLMLQKKLKEKMWDFFLEESPEELADILEVMHAICKNKWFSMNTIENLRLQKRKEKGWFDKQIILDSVGF